MLITFTQAIPPPLELGHSYILYNCASFKNEHKIRIELS